MRSAQNHRSPRPGGLVLSAFTPYRLVALGRMMSQQLGAAYESEALTIPEWRVLAVVSQADEVAARDVVAQTPMDKMAVSRAVASLEEKALVARRAAADRRVSALSLTEKGRAVYGRVAMIALGYEKRLLEMLSPEEADAFFAGLTALEDAAAEIEPVGSISD